MKTVRRMFSILGFPYWRDESKAVSTDNLGFTPKPPPKGVVIEPSLGLLEMRPIEERDGLCRRDEEQETEEKGVTRRKL